MIRKPGEFTATKKYRIMIYGIPGMGKTTLALSAPKPLLVDADKGINRIEPRFRVPNIQPLSYQEILDDLIPENVADFETLVFDTGGTLFDFMVPWIIKNNPKSGNGHGGLGLKGYGEISEEFKRLCNFVSNSLNKHLVIVFHAKEDKDGDITKWRPDIAGQTKNEIWKPIDLGGFIEAQDQKRTVSFNAMQERYLAKGNRSVNEKYEIPDLDKVGSNTFLTHLIEKLDESEKEAAKEIEKYNELMKQIDSILESIKDARTATEAFKSIKELNHIFSSKDEAGAKIKAATSKLGLKFDFKAMEFVKED